MCRLPWSRHHSALALPRRSAEAPFVFPVSAGEMGSGLGWAGVFLPAFPAFLFLNRVGSKNVSNSGAWERGKVLDDSRSCLSSSPHPSFLGTVLRPCGVPEPALTLMPVPLSHSHLEAPGVGGKRHLVSCHSQQASPVFPLCPPWGTGRVGEERESPEQLGGARPKRLP